MGLCCHLTAYLQCTYWAKCHCKAPIKVNQIRNNKNRYGSAEITCLSEYSPFGLLGTAGKIFFQRRRGEHWWEPLRGTAAHLKKWAPSQFCQKRHHETSWKTIWEPPWNHYEDQNTEMLDLWSESSQLQSKRPLNLDMQFLTHHCLSAPQSPHVFSLILAVLRLNSVPTVFFPHRDSVSSDQDQLTDRHVTHSTWKHNSFFY